MCPETLQDFPTAGPGLLSAIVGAYTQGASVHLRGGIALALSASAPQWRSEDASVALDFLLGCGFADRDDDVRSAMVEAGAVPRPERDLTERDSGHPSVSDS